MSRTMATDTGLSQRDEKDVERLLHLVAGNKVSEVESCLADGTSSHWRHVIRHEVSLSGNGIWRLDESVVLKLMSCEVTSITAFHLAALLGSTDIIVSFIDNDIPVDFPLQVGGLFRVNIKHKCHY